VSGDGSEGKAITLEENTQRLIFPVLSSAKNSMADFCHWGTTDELTGQFLGDIGPLDWVSQLRGIWFAKPSGKEGFFCIDGPGSRRPSVTIDS
jgi:hypothetical protein